MKAIRIHEFGGPEVLRIDSLDRPEPANGEVLVKVRAAGVNPVDWKTREGHFPPIEEKNLPLTLGREVCGEVTEKGPDVEDFAAGEPVFANLDLFTGGYGDYVLVPADLLAPKPRLLSDAEASATPLAALTGWQALFDHGGLARGQRVLIHGGSGGVGHFAVQLAKHFGAWVATTVPKEDLDFAASLGADRPIERAGSPFEDQLDPVDLVIDLVGGEIQDHSFEALRPGGTLVSTVEDPSQAASERGLTGRGFMTKPDAGQLPKVQEIIDESALKVALERSYPLDHAAEAQEHLRHEHVRGKLALIVSDPIPEGT